MIDGCIESGKTPEEGGAIYNFTGPQGFGIANMADAMYAVKKLVFEEKKFTMAELKAALEANFGGGNGVDAQKLTTEIARQLAATGKTVGEKEIAEIYMQVSAAMPQVASGQGAQILEEIEKLDRFGNDSVINLVFKLAGYTYGPILGMFAFGILCKYQIKERFVPIVAILSPILSYLLQWATAERIGYFIGFELLGYNALFTIFGLLLIIKPKTENE